MIRSTRFLPVLCGAALFILNPLLAEVVKQPEDGYIIRGSRRSLEEIQKTYSKMPRLRYTPRQERWKRLPLTLERLRSGETVRVVMLGDSIINDISRSEWDLLLEQRLEGVQIEKITSVRGGTGCWWYKEGDRLETFVLDWNPDLVMIGGISHRKDIGSVRSIVEAIQSRSEAEILLMNGAFGQVDPDDDQSWQEIRDRDPKDYTTRLKKLAAQCGVGFLDLRKPWARYIRRSGCSIETFHRDAVHANAKGEQIVGRILARFLTPSGMKSSSSP